MAYQLSKIAASKAREEFTRALALAVPAYELGQLGLFTEDSEAFIRKEVERKLYEPKLANAGDRERRWIERLEKLAKDREWSWSGDAYALAQRLRTLLPFGGRESNTPIPYWKAAGCYYIRKPITWKSDKDRYEKLMLTVQVNEGEKGRDKKWFAKLLLQGWPEAVSNFKIECLYLLRKPDGSMERTVRLKNGDGEVSGEVKLSDEQFASPEKFRRFGLGRGNFAWSGNQTELQLLHADICKEAAWKIINEVVMLGWYPLRKGKDGKLEGVWFGGDYCYRDDKLLEMAEDEEGKPNGCYWLATPSDDNDTQLPEQGYQISEQGRENDFFQKKPLLHPKKRITGLKLELSDAFGNDPGLTDANRSQEAELTARFFRELCGRVKMISGESANLIVGTFASYAAAPEIFAKYGFFPGVWLHGSLGAGKSKILEFLMEFWGYVVQEGIILRGTNSTATGLTQAADQYSNQPVFLNEYISTEVDDEKHAVIHNSYNRGGQVKFNLAKLQRHVRTAFVVAGENTTNKTSMRSRFPHVQIAKGIRTGTPAEQQANFEWFLRNRDKFFVFGRFLLEHRSQFVPLVFKHLAAWFREENIDPRLKDSHGPAFAAWMAMAELLQPCMGASEFADFKKFMVEHTKAANLDVVGDTNINVYWTDLIPAVKAGAIPKTCFHLKKEHGVACAPGAVNLDIDGELIQKGWTHYDLYIEPNSTITHLSMWLAKMRGTVSLKKNDLRDQLSKELYWIKGNLRQRFTATSTGGIPCWGIDVDKHPLGYQPVTDAEYLHYRENMKEGDPRKGPLFEIIEWIENKDREDNPAGTD